jgi:hypothetical protein
MGSLSWLRSTLPVGTTANSGSRPLDLWLVQSTRIKLGEMRWSILARRDDLRQEAVADSYLAATLACGAYLAHARPELSFEHIKDVLISAGGHIETIESEEMAENLHNWRNNGGYTDDEILAIRERTEAKKAKARLRK